MKIPKQVTVGKKTYKIARPHTVQDPASYGRTYFDDKLIELAVYDKFGNKYSTEEVDDTFWHELTHAILYDMGHSLWDNEVFVTAFANRLTDAVNSAKF